MPLSQSNNSFLAFIFYNSVLGYVQEIKIFFIPTALLVNLIYVLLFINIQEN